MSPTDEPAPPLQHCNPHGQPMAVLKNKFHPPTLTRPAPFDITAHGLIWHINTEAQPTTKVKKNATVY